MFPLNIVENSYPRKIKAYVRDALKHQNRTLDIKEPCVNVSYIENGEEWMHIDLPVYAQYDGNVYLARGSEFAKEGNYRWEDADPEGLNEWLLGKITGNDQLRRNIRYIKKWKQEVITRILRNPVYKGGMYVHGTSKPTFKCRGRGYIRRADREVLEDVHEAVVTKEVWQTANDIIDRHTKVKPCTSGYENIFRGLLKCPDCGQTLLIHTDNRNPDRDLLDKTYYQCTTYRKKGANFCTAHRISAGDIESAIKADIDRHAVKAMKDKEKFINNVLLSMNESSAERSEKIKAEIDKLKKRNAELDQMYIRLYEDYSGGKLSEKKFTMMSAHYEQEQDANEEKLLELERQHKAKSAAVTNAEQFTESLAQCAGMKKLTATVLNTLIEKIEVHNPVMVNGEKEQKLTVYYKFVGQID